MEKKFKVYKKIHYDYQVYETWLVTGNTIEEAVKKLEDNVCDLFQAEFIEEEQFYTTYEPIKGSYIEYWDEDLKQLIFKKEVE
jgi:hypothetical protein